MLVVSKPDVMVKKNPPPPGQCHVPPPPRNEPWPPLSLNPPLQKEDPWPGPMTWGRGVVGFAWVYVSMFGAWDGSPAVLFHVH